MNALKTFLQARMTPIVGAALGLVAMVALGYATRWGKGLGTLSAVWFWTGFCVLLVALLVVVVLWVLPHYRERRFLAALRAEEGQTPEDDADKMRRQLRHKMLEAIATLERSPDLRQKTRFPLYALPWYLQLGASQGGKTTLLRQVASRFCPFGRPANVNGPTQDCDWWLFNTAIILDTSGRYAFPTQVERDSAEWYRLLQLLRYYRERQPINGVIIALAAADLVSRGQAALRSEAVELRKRLDEAVRELGVDFPVYVLITQCDTIEGFREFFGCFPEHTRQQVLGFVNELRPQEGTVPPPATSAAVPRFETLFTSLVERLQQLRLSLLQEKPPGGLLRQKVFCFPEEFHALQQPLHTFVEALFGENPYQHTPFFRGLFFCSAMQQGTLLSFVRHEFHIENQDKPQSGGTQDYFLHDLFAVVLPRDQYLVRRTLKASRTTRRLGLFGFASCLTLCLLAALLLIQTYRHDRALYSAAHTAPCQAADEPAPTAPRLDQVDQCRQAVQRLSDHNRQRSFLGKLLFHRSVTLEETLRQRYVEQFEHDVLAPLDAHTAPRLAAGADTPPLAMLLLDRLDLLRQCLAATECPEPITKDGQPDYRLMLTGALPQPPQQEQVSQLQVAYEGYLQWSSGPKAALRREQAAHTARLHGWITSASFASQVVLWTSQHYSPVTAQEYWDASTPAERDQTMRVDGAYTRAGWEAGLLPLLQRTDRAVPDVGQTLARFRRAYATQYFEAWQRFLEGFPHGQEAWTQPRERRLQLTARLLVARSPYHRSIDVAFANLQPLLPEAATPDTRITQDATGTIPRETKAEAHQDDVPTWCRVLQRYVGSESRRAYVETLEQLGKQLDGSGMKTRSFALAQSGFQEGTPTEQSTHPILKAWWVIDQFQRQEASGETAASAVFWPLLQWPILFVWRVILEEASFTVQERWNDLLLEVKDLPPSQKHELLYGKEGRAVAFVKGPAAVFLQRRGEDYTRRRLLESEMPFTDAFLLYLKQARVGLPTPVPEVTKRRVLIRATPPSLEASGNLKIAKTALILDCDTGRQVLETVDSSTELTFIWSVTNCAETLLRLHLADDSEQPLEPLELRYQDLGQFLAQFNSSQRVFRLADFKVERAAQYSSYGIRTITLRYRFAPEARQQIQKDMDDYKRYVVDTQRRLELPTKIVRIEP